MSFPDVTCFCHFIHYALFGCAFFVCQGRGKSAKNARKGQNPEALEEQYKKCPHSMVFHRGNVGVNIRRLVKDVRRVMEPFTAINLKVSSSSS